VAQWWLDCGFAMESDYDAHVRASRMMMAGCSKIKFKFRTNRRVIDVLNEVLQVREASPRSRGTKKDGSGMHKNQI
jgi:hypothetical protein